MIVQRNTVRLQLGKLQEANALVKAELERVRFPNAARVYAPKFGVADMHIGEYEFANLAELEQFWTNWNAQPEAQAFLQKYSELIQPGMVSEVFDLV